MPTKDNDKVKLVEAANNSFDESKNKDNADNKAKSKFLSSHPLARNGITYNVEFHAGNKGSDKTNPHIFFTKDNIGDVVEYFGKATFAKLLTSALGHYFKILMHGNFKGAGDKDKFLDRFADPNFGLGKRSDGNKNARIKAKLLAKGMTEEEADEILDA